MTHASSDRPLGPLLPNWTPPPRPARADLPGRYARLEPLTPDHAPDFFAAAEGHDWIWDYMPDGPFAKEADYLAWSERAQRSPDPHFFAIRDLETGKATGVASYLRITPEAGSIEVGNICLTPALQRTRAATEAMALMMGWAFDAGYRRYEWKCNALNLPSRAAAQRLGFSFEGVFRQAIVVKNRNRDTSWFSVIDSEWPALKQAFDTWLAPENFDEAGQQRVSLSALTAPLVAMRDPALTGAS